MNENTLEEVFTLKLSFLSGFLVLLGFGVLLIALTSIVIINTPIRNYLPGYLDSEIRQEMIESVLRTDSLEQMMQVQSRYLENMTAILKGDTAFVIPEPDTVMVDVSSLEKSQELADFIRNYEEEERYNLHVLIPSRSLPENLVFYRPVRGIVSERFNIEKKHFGTDIATTPRESVIATMKGTVIFTGFDANAGYIIQLQHPNGFVSIYKHNAVLLKKQGEEVNAGEAIAIAGNTGNLSSGVHLHFELWYNGNPINPEEFIVF